MRKWRTRLEIWNDGEKKISQWINVLCGFLQGDRCLPVGFCLIEIPVCNLLQDTTGYPMGVPGARDVKRGHSFFVDDLKTYQESHKALRDADEMIVQASHDTGTCYGVEKCAEIVFEHGKMVRGEGLQVLHERMKTMDLDQTEIYKFLGVEQADGIEAKEVYARVKKEVTRRLEILTKTELNDKNLIRAISKKVIPVAAYSMNVCRFTKTELTELDQIIKRERRKNNMLIRQSSDERLYMKRSAGGRRLKSLREVYEEARLRVAGYMVTSENIWIKAAWRSDTMKESNSIKGEAIGTMKAVGKTLDFEGESVILEGEKINGDWKQIWTKIKTSLIKGLSKEDEKFTTRKKCKAQFIRSKTSSVNYG